MINQIPNLSIGFHKMLKNYEVSPSTNTVAGKTSVICMLFGFAVYSHYDLQSASHEIVCIY